MNQDNRHIHWGLDEHPPMELLQQYQEDVLPPALRHQVELHLLDCALCSDMVEGQAMSESSRIDATEEELNRRIAATFTTKKQKTLPVYLPDWRVAAAIVLVSCTTALVFYYNYTEIKQQKQTIATAPDRAIQESMDLSEKPAPSAPQNLVDAAPDTVRQTIAVNTTPPRLKTISHTPPRLVSQELEFELETEQELNEVIVITDDELAVAPPAKVAEVAEVAMPIAVKQKSAFLPETTAVSRALQGQVAGVAIRGANSSGIKQVQGQVLSSDGEPLPGVTVTVKGTNTGVVTDMHGNFSLSMPADKSTLLFRFIGYETAEKALYANTDHLTVNMQVDNRALSEVVVTGYGTAATKSPVLKSAKPAISMKAYRKYLKENIRYSPNSEKGRVVIKATVSPSGALQNLQITKSLCPSCDEEALRLVSQGPGWEPATKNGSSVEQEVRIVVRFRPDNK